MKNLLFILSILLLVSCNGGEKAQNASSSTKDTTPASSTAAPVMENIIKNKQARIIGKITNPSSNIIQLIDDGAAQNVQIQNGVFAFDVKMAEAGFYTLQYGRQSAEIYVAPDSKLTININGQLRPGTMQMTGEGAKENNYLIAKQKLLQNSKNAISIREYKLETADFVKKAEEKNDALVANFNAVKNNLSPEFVKLEETNLLYTWGTDRLNYPLYHAFYAQKPEFVAPEGYNDFMGKLDINNPDYFKAPTYKKFVTAYINSKVEDEMSKNEELRIAGNGRTKAFFNLATSLVSSSRSKSYLLHQSLQQHIQYNGADGTDELIQIFNNHNTNPTYQRTVNNAYSKWAHLAEGKPAPGFNYVDIKGKPVSLKDLKGKLVYIDVWATWCGPCKKEIPHLEELQHEYKDNGNVVFASVSVDANKQAWEKMVTDKNMGGLQLYAGKGANISQDYMIRGIPRFILVDGEGNIISANAPRPSSERIKLLLAKHIKNI